MQFENQVVLVSGAGRGIGKEIALSFAREGADIGFADVNEETAQATANEIKKLGRRVFFSRTDVRDYDQVQRFVAGAVGELGRIDVLINNAGIAKPQPFLEITRENWENHLGIHLFGAFYCSQAAAREMAKRKYGRIVSLASVAGFMSPIDQTAYGVAKSGIIGLTRSMALELADYGITANAIAPGPIDTEILGGVDQGGLGGARQSSADPPPGQAGGNCARRAVSGCARVGLHIRSDPGGRRRIGCGRRLHGRKVSAPEGWPKIKPVRRRADRPVFVPTPFRPVEGPLIERDRVPASQCRRGLR